MGTYYLNTVSLTAECSEFGHYVADVISAQDYYPFGSTMPGRIFNGGDYRYGFQGQEKDDEIKGAGNSINYKYRMYDPRTGRFFAVDPLSAKYPHYTPYSFSGNKVIHAIELEGLEEVVITNALNQEKYMGQMWKIIDNNDVLREVYHSVSRADRIATDKVILGVAPTDNIAGKNRGGFTISSGDMYSAAYHIKEGIDFEGKELYEETFRSNNITPDEILNSDKRVSFVGIDPADIGEDGVEGTKSLMHEINQHLRNRLNGKDGGPEGANEHFEHHRDPNLSDEENEKFRSRNSPANPSPNSIQGKLNSEVDKSASDLKKKNDD